MSSSQALQEGFLERRMVPSEPCGAARRDDTPVVEVDDLVTALDLVEIRAGQQDGRASGVEVVEEIPELEPRQRVDTGGGLVEQQDRWPVQERADERQLLLHAPRELAGQGRPPLGEPGEGKQLLGAGGERRPVEPVDARHRGGATLRGTGATSSCQHRQGRRGPQS
jgi:hypothetical protein